MASSSIIANLEQKRYQVFLSFRGEDTRQTFTSHLYEALREKGVATFIDNDLKRGNQISLSLLSAIRGSMISVIILSERYASSRWCLDELVEIIKCKHTNKQIVLPVFYHVDPSHVRKQEGTFGNSFAVLEKRFEDRVDIVQRWRSALTEAGNISGWPVDGEESETSLVKKIVNDILMQLRSAIPPNDYKNLVGLESSIKKIESLLNSDVCAIGIWGIGGVGKTTIARVVFNRNYGHFQRFHFIENVRERLQDPNGSVRLRKELLFAILRDKHADIKSPIIKQRLGLMKIFIVFDDVTCLQQIEDLIGDFKDMGVGSRIMITTRDKQVLDNCGVDKIYKVVGLSYPHDFHLFRQYAFRLNHIPKDYQELSNKLVNYATGLPLALKILGGFVYGKKKEFWESAISKLQNTPHLDINKVLKVSYDGLDNEKQYIFLDIACFFNGMNKDLVTDILNACDLHAVFGIEVLIDKCLIDISFGKRISMHDLLKEMGKEIVKGEKDLNKRSRLWNYKDIENALTNNKGSEATRGILLDMFGKEDILHLNPLSFSNMHQLMFLKVHTAFNSKVNGFSGIEYDFTELRYLDWPGYQCKSLPLNFQPEKLVSLEMANSNLEQLWTGVKILVRLKYIDLSYSKHLLKIPDLSQATNLENLNLNECTSLIEITLPPKRNLKLVKLSLRNCIRLSRLPLGIQANSLTLFGCTSLRVAPTMSRDMVELCLDGTAIKELSSSNEYPVSLIRLNLENCSMLETLPFGICNWKSLRHLALSGCSNLKTIPKMPCQLEYLYLVETDIEELSSSIEHLTNLRKLSLEKCLRLNCLPNDISNFKFLYYISLSGCLNLKVLPKFLGCRIARLLIDGTAIKVLPSSIENLSSLFQLNANNCVSLEYLPEEICMLKSLRYLRLSGCSKIDRLPDELGNLEALVNLEAGGIAIKRIPSSILHLENLNHLSFEGCKSLELVGSSLCTLLGLSSLTSLNLSTLSVVNSLTSLNLADCCIRELPKGLFNLSTLRYLDISKNNFESIPTSIINLSNLEELFINHCERLQFLPKLPYGMTDLEAMGCTSLQVSSDLGILFPSKTRAKKVSFTNCFNLGWNSLTNMKDDLHGIQRNTTSFADTKELSNAWEYFIVCFPESEIPKSFDNQGTGSCIKLPRSSLDNLHGFAFCVVLSFQYSHEEKTNLYLKVHFGVNNENGCHQELFFEPVRILKEALSFESDHAIIGYMLAYGIDDLDLTDSSVATMRFDLCHRSDDYHDDQSQRAEGCQVKRSGVHLFFTQDCEASESH